MKVIYTDAAKVELDSYLTKQRDLLERFISERKYVMGDESIEITASDIRELADRVRLMPFSRSRYEMMRLASRMYMVMGLLLAVGAFLYPQVQLMFAENRYQGMLLVAGLALFGVGFLGSYVYQARLRRYDEIDREVRSTNNKA